MGNNNRDCELMHYGVKGMRWGVRRTPEQLGHKNLKRAKTANLDKWGKDPDHNVCYVSGLSGSGKSTVAKSLADKSTEVIHLDLYFEGDGNLLTIGGEGRNREFDRYLDSNKIKAPNEVSRKDWSSNKTLQKFEEAIESFGRNQYSKGKKIVAEGVQILDDSVRPDKSFFSNKPIILLSTNPVTSIHRAFERDGRGNLITGLHNLDSAKEYIDWVSQSNAQINSLATRVRAQKGKEWVRNYLKNTAH